MTQPTEQHGLLRFGFGGGGAHEINPRSGRMARFRALDEQEVNGRPTLRRYQPELIKGSARRPQPDAALASRNAHGRVPLRGESASVTARTETSCTHGAPG